MLSRTDRRSVRHGDDATGAVPSLPMDFAWTEEQVELRLRARKVAQEAVERYGRANDSWINGYSKEFSRQLAAHGWIGMTWPVEHGGGGRPPIERLIVAEEMISVGAPIAASWFADRQMGPSLMTYGTPEQIRALLPDILAGESTWCIGMSEPGAGSDLASLRTERGARRRRLRHQRAEDLDQLRRGGGLLLPDLPYVDRGAAPRGDQRGHRADDDTRHRSPPHRGHDHQPPLLRGVLHRCPGPGHQPGRGRRVGRSSRRCANSSTSVVASIG